MPEYFVALLTRISAAPVMSKRSTFTFQQEKGIVMSTHPLTMSRTGAFAGIAALHACLIYAIAASIGVLNVPLPPEFHARFIADDKPAVHETPTLPVLRPRFSVEPIRAKEVLPFIIDEPPIKDQIDTVAVEPRTTTTHEPGNGVEEPVRLISAVPLITREPSYPVASIRNDEQGVVTVKALVGADGRVTEVIVIKSSGYPRLDAAALESIRTWKFRPGSQAGTAVASWVSLPVRFQLRS